MKIKRILNSKNSIWKESWKLGIPDFESRFRVAWELGWEWTHYKWSWTSFSYDGTSQNWMVMIVAQLFSPVPKRQQILNVIVYLSSKWFFYHIAVTVRIFTLNWFCEPRFGHLIALQLASSYQSSHPGSVKNGYIRVTCIPLQ